MEVRVVIKSDFGHAMARLDAEFMAPSLTADELYLRTKPGREVHQLGLAASTNWKSMPKSSQTSSVSYIDIDSVDTDDGVAYPDLLLTEDLPSRAQYVVAPLDILISNVRPNRGGVSLMGGWSTGAVASSGFTLLRLAPECELTPEYLFSFLRSRFGRVQLIRRTRGSMYPAVTEGDVKELWIVSPTPAIAEGTLQCIHSALEYQREFFKQVNRAEERFALFLAPYGAPPDPVQTHTPSVVWASVKAREMLGQQGQQRLDAEFFRPEYAVFEKRCKSLGQFFYLGDHFDLFPGGGFKSGEDEVPCVKQGILTNYGINWSAIAVEQAAWPASGRVKAGDILLACAAHEIFYVGRKVDYVRAIPSNLSKNVCVSDVLIIRAKSPEGAELAPYVSTFLRHPAGLYQVQRCIRGLRGGHVYKDDLARMVIVPKPDGETLNELNGLTAAIESSRNSSKEQVRKAISIVESYCASL